MNTVEGVRAYSDERGNRIEYEGPEHANARIKFTGRNNRLRVATDARLGKLVIDFDCDNGTVELGSGGEVPAFAAAIRVGQDASVLIGDDVSVTSVVAISAVEGVTVSVGNDVMFASDNQVRADDGHPIFDVVTGQRVNPAKPIVIGNHVWLGKGAVLLGGAQIGDGSVVGYGSIVTKPFPNNCIIAGVPARVIRRDIAWERPHLSLRRPYYKPDASTIGKSAYWRRTEEPTPRQLSGGREFQSTVKSLVGAIRPLPGRVRGLLGQVRRRARRPRSSEP